MGISLKPYLLECIEAPRRSDTFQGPFFFSPFRQAAASSALQRGQLKNNEEKPRAAPGRPELGPVMHMQPSCIRFAAFATLRPRLDGASASNFEMTRCLARFLVPLSNSTDICYITRSRSMASSNAHHVRLLSITSRGGISETMSQVGEM